MTSFSVIKSQTKINLAPSVILVRPQLGENIGAVARAMMNFGWKDLRLVMPRDGWPNKSAVAAASGAGSILDNARLFQTIETACEDLNFIFATTIRRRDLSKEVYEPYSAVKKSITLIREQQRVGILFGPERSGLESSEVACTNGIISIRVNPSFSSINLAQSVLIMAYEWFKLAESDGLPEISGRSLANARRIEVEHLILKLFLELGRRGYFWPKDKKHSLEINLKNLFHRLPLSSSDVRTIHGIIKTLTKKLN